MNSRIPILISTVQRRLAWGVVAVLVLMATGCAHWSDQGGRQSPGARPPNTGDGSPADIESRQRGASLPLIRLSPATLGRSLVEQQRFTIRGPGGQTAQLDAVLEIDPHSVRLAFLQMGRVMARLEWDGGELNSSQARGWPKHVSQERILSDLQMALWPLPTVQAGLPPSWTIEQEGSRRHLRKYTEDKVRFTTHEPGNMDIEYLDTGWSLNIRSHTAHSSQRGTP